jgi:ArsR family transcriptional regulator, cadmium/lead-responsive transcriptional repressor
MINKTIMHACHKEGFSSVEMYGAYKIFFGTLVSESRLKIINVLRRGKKNVSELTEEIGVSQSNLSHDLARLKQCGFVTCEMEGKFRYYSLNVQTIKPLMELIEKHMGQHCVHILRTAHEAS